MSKNNIKKNYHFLHMLVRSRTPQKRALLHTADNAQIKSMCEVCLNVLKGNIPVNIKKMKKYKYMLRKLASKTIPYESKKRMLINQSGGFLPVIAPAIISALGGILGRVISKKL